MSESRMRRFQDRRQVLLLFSAMLIPCLALVALSVRLIRQDAELRDKRMADERRRVLQQTATRLLSKLEGIKASALHTSATPSYGRNVHPALVLVASTSDGNLALPWDITPPSRGFLNARDQPYFEPNVRHGEREQFALGRPDRAVRSYTLALQSARLPQQSAYARLLRARALDHSGRQREAVADFRLLLGAGVDLADEDGVSFRLLAADRLADAGFAPDALVEAIASVLDQRAWLPPPAYYIASAVTQKVSGKVSAPQRLREMNAAIEKGIAATAQAVALKNDFSRLILPHLRDNAAGPVWAPYGEETWLVSRGAARVIAVRAKDVFAELEAESGQVRFLAPWGAGGELLGHSFPGLKVALHLPEDTAATGRNRLEATFLYAAIALALTAALFGAYLLWRDLHREMLLAETRSQFVSSVSHELKTPLTAISMFAETLQLRPHEAKVANEYLETIVQECGRLSRLVDGILRFSRIERSAMAYQFHAVFPGDVVEAAMRTLQHVLTRQGFRVAIHIDDDVPAMRADRDALHDAVLNLLSNAMKYSGDARDIAVELRKDAHHAVIRVTDHGCGIPASEQERIFRKFYRVPCRQNESIPGTGLGLTIVAHTVKAHGGRVAVKSVVGAGSVFSIFLPLENRT